MTTADQEKLRLGELDRKIVTFNPRYLETGNVRQTIWSETDESGRPIKSHGSIIVMTPVLKASMRRICLSLVYLAPS